MPHLDIDPGRNPYDNFRSLLATIAFPQQKDEDIRFEFIKVMSGASIDRCLSTLGFDKEIRTRLLFMMTEDTYLYCRDTNSMQQLFESNLRKSFITGLQLFTLYFFHKKNEPISMKLSEEIVSSIKAISKTIIRGLWSKYKNISPYAAALFFFKHNNVLDDDDKNTRTMLNDIISIGSKLRTFAEKTKFNPCGKEIENKFILQYEHTWKEPHIMQAIIDHSITIEADELCSDFLVKTRETTLKRRATARENRSQNRKLANEARPEK